jgi:hypothetical protein
LQPFKKPCRALHGHAGIGVVSVVVVVLMVDELDVLDVLDVLDEVVVGVVEDDFVAVVVPVERSTTTLPPQAAARTTEAKARPRARIEVMRASSRRAGAGRNARRIHGPRPASALFAST